jgi:hypothetical protein
MKKFHRNDTVIIDIKYILLAFRCYSSYNEGLGGAITRERPAWQEEARALKGKGLRIRDEQP